MLKIIYIFQGKKKNSAGGKYGHWEQVEQGWGYLAPRTSLKMNRVWVITRLPTTNLVKKNDLHFCLCLPSY